MLQIIRPLLGGSRTGNTVTRVLGKPLLGRYYGTVIYKLRSANGIKLGMLTLNPMNPLSDYHQVLPVNGDNKLPEIRTVANLSEIDMKATKTSWISHALQFMGLKISSNKNHLNKLSIVEVQNVELPNSSTMFREALANSPETQDWITNNVIKPGNSAYLIVGYTKLSNPKGESSREVDGDGLITAEPSELVTQGMALTAPVVGAIKPITSETRVEGTSNRSHNSLQKYEVNGDVMYAIQYRKLKFTWLKPAPSTFDQLRLGENTWEVVWPTRGTDGQEEKAAVEAELDQNAGIDPEDMESVDDDDEEVAWERRVRVVERDGKAVEEEFWVSADPDMGIGSGSETLRR